jgi:hypothetical protein
MTVSFSLNFAIPWIRLSILPHLELLYATEITDNSLMDLILFPASLNDLQILSFGSILAIEGLLSNEHSIFIMPHAYLSVKEPN